MTELTQTLRRKTKMQEFNKGFITGLTTGLLVGAMVIIAGCSLEGGASWRIGMTNSNFLEVGHEVDGDKQGNTASIKLDQNLWDLMSPASKPDAEDQE